MSKFISCKDCTKREVGCHSKCSEYLSMRKAQDEIREKRLLANELHESVNDAQWNGYHRKNLKKWRKK